MKKSSGLLRKKWYSIKKSDIYYEEVFPIQIQNETGVWQNMIKAGIIGATGYAGGELVRILANHKDVEIKWYGSRSYIDKKYYQVYRNMFEIVEDTCLDDNLTYEKRILAVLMLLFQYFCILMKMLTNLVESMSFDVNMC